MWSYGWRGAAGLRQFFYRRRIPFAGESIRRGRVKTHGQVERPSRGWQPICFFVFAGTFVLKVKVERSIRAGLERKVTADRETIERVRHLKALGIIKREGPEGVHRRRGSLVEADPIFVRAVERLAGVVEEVQRIDRVFRQVGPKADLGDDGALLRNTPI